MPTENLLKLGCNKDKRYIPGRIRAQAGFAACERRLFYLQNMFLQAKRSKVQSNRSKVN